MQDKHKRTQQNYFFSQKWLMIKSLNYNIEMCGATVK